MKPGQNCYTCQNTDPASKPTMTSGMMSCDNPFSNITQYYDNSDPCKRTRTSLANDHLPKPNNKPGFLCMPGKGSDSIGLNPNTSQIYSKFMQENKVPDSGAPKAS